MFDQSLFLHIFVDSSLLYIVIDLNFSCYYPLASSWFFFLLLIFYSLHPLNLIFVLLFCITIILTVSSAASTKYALNYLRSRYVLFTDKWSVYNDSIWSDTHYLCFINCILKRGIGWYFLKEIYSIAHSEFRSFECNNNLIAANLRKLNL